MCVASAYLKQRDQEKLLMEEIALIRVEGESLYLKSIFGEEKSVPARIKEIDFVTSKIVLEGPAT
ncbi:MAG: CooT family nickel-binding protein [Candidatus Latescibacteria bacterium]|nr:CooT family nickel-binding protein [Candidatus Latescibacterota bacterium]